MFGNAMFGGQDFGNMMQSAQNSFAGSIPPINIGYYNATQNNPATQQQQMDPMQYQQYMLGQFQQQMAPQQQQVDPYEYQRQMQQQYQQQQQQVPADGQQMDPMQYQQYMQQQYMQQINPQQQAMPAQQDTGMTAQLANQPVSFRNPDFYAQQQYLGFMPMGGRYIP
jgi:hypothetical protein